MVFAPKLLLAAFFVAALLLDLPGQAELTSVDALVGNYCLECHDAEVHKGGLNLEAMRAGEVAPDAEAWERVVRQLRARQMPPIGKDRPEAAAYEGAATALESALDRVAAEHPHPGRTDTLRRLTRYEYQNAIRDLLALEVDVARLLPPDEASHGFDNVTVGELSPTLLNRYITAAQEVSRLAVGGEQNAVQGETIRLRPDLTQESHVPGLPLGTRGGAVIGHTFPQDGTYAIEVRLARDRNEHVEGLHQSHQMEIYVDEEHLRSFEVVPPEDGEDYTQVDRHLNLRAEITAGPHDLGITFVDKGSPLLETRRQPYNAHFNMHRHPRLSPAVYQITITGPFEAKGPGDTPSRRRIFVARASSPEEEEGSAKEILRTLMRRAFRRPVDDADLAGPWSFYESARSEGGFEAGIEAALSAVLVSREFLFRVETDPEGLAPATPYVVSDIDLASRLSFFLWSSIPDEELIGVAARGDLSRPAVFEKQVRRMLAHPRSKALVENFGSQWLYLRNLDAITPDGRLFPDFDDNLRQAFRRETEWLFATVLREDRSVLDLFRMDRTWLNERLAKHYGIPHVYGSRFREVEVGEGERRGGLLRQGSILTVTSYATRTSPVIRGHWILENLLGTPPPPPPPDVPALEENTVSSALPLRERLAAHRSSPACASCHRVMDPIGFSLENYDAVGRWRVMEAGLPVDAEGGMPDGSRFSGVDGLEKALLERPEILVRTLCEKLLTYALGRGVESYDAPAIRKILRSAAEEDYRFSAIILGIANSTPFRMRTSQ